VNITPELITQLARLSRVGLVEGEEHRLMRDLTQILHYIEQLSKVDVSGVEPLRQVVPGVQCPRCADEVVGEQLLNRDTFLANAPAHVAGMVRVPAVMQGYES
jgi:aspartyl-tRNA(Asn)/glutamyl-tRNA(Gln) amidotransferase subunit C